MLNFINNEEVANQDHREKSFIIHFSCLTKPGVDKDVDQWEAVRIHCCWLLKVFTGTTTFAIWHYLIKMNIYIFYGSIILILEKLLKMCTRSNVQGCSWSHCSGKQKRKKGAHGEKQLKFPLTRKKINSVPLHAQAPKWEMGLLNKRSLQI